MDNDEKKIMEAFQRELGRHMEKMNSMPMEEMDNLSPNDMQFILYNTFGEGSPLQYKRPVGNEVIEQIPFYRLFRKYLDKIEQANELKLTAKGNLPTKVCQYLYNTGIIKEEMIERGIVKLYKEADSDVLPNLKIIGNLSGVTKKRNNKLSLTKKGRELYEAEDQFPLFQQIFETNAFRFNLGYHDGYPQQAGVQAVLGYTFYLLLRYGKETRELQFYVDKNLQAFPQIVLDFESDWSTPERQYRHCYYIRAFDRFLSYYGFIEAEKTQIPKSIDKKIEVRATDLFREVFEIRTENFKFSKTRHDA